MEFWALNDYFKYNLHLTQPERYLKRMIFYPKKRPLIFYPKIKTPHGAAVIRLYMLLWIGSVTYFLRSHTPHNSLI